MTNDRENRLVALLVSTTVRPSLRRATGDADEFFDTFYATLAVAIPGVGDLFHQVDMSRQNRLVHDGIERLLDLAERSSPDARTELERLGHLHGRDGLNIDPAYYPGWVDTLVATVREFDPEFSDDHEVAWREVLAGGIALIVDLYETPQPTID